MKLKVFSIFDHKAKAFMQPFYQQTEGLAIRAFTSAVNDPSTQFNKYPEDFVLYCHGVWDDAVGMFTQDSSPVPVIRADQVLADVAQVKPATNVVPIKKEDA